MYVACQLFHINPNLLQTWRYFDEDCQTAPARLQDDQIHEIIDTRTRNRLP